MTAPLIDLPTIRVEGFHTMQAGSEAGRWSTEYRFGFCFAPEGYAPSSTERANFLVGCCHAVFGRAQ